MNPSVQAEISRLDPFRNAGNTASLGRLADSLSAEYNVNAFSVDTTLIALEGNDVSVPKTAVNSELGFHKFNPSAVEGDVISSHFGLINGDHEPGSSFFSNTWSSSLVSKDFVFPLLFTTSSNNTVYCYGTCSTNLSL